uniref:Uncharacterized protein n=1 Tax=Anguilla anguilla TaxID=7936 RepID=A0A0E9XW56_ANGAN
MSKFTLNNQHWSTVYEARYLPGLFSHVQFSKCAVENTVFLYRWCW